jgi:hypothetical protein
MSVHEQLVGSYLMQGRSVSFYLLAREHAVTVLLQFCFFSLLMKSHCFVLQP